MKEKLAFADFDGTWSDHPELWGIVEGIITGRSWEDYDGMMAYKEGPDVPIFMNPVPVSEINFTSIITHKAHVLEKTGATDYYEDQPEQANAIKLLCPEVKIHIVKDGQTSI